VLKIEKMKREGKIPAIKKSEAQIKKEEILARMSKIKIYGKLIPHKVLMRKCKSKINTEIQTEIMNENSVTTIKSSLISPKMNVFFI